MFHDLTGYVPFYLAPVSGAGTVTVPTGGSILLIVAHASAGGAYVTIYGGNEIPVVNGAPPMSISFNHDLWVSNSSNSGAVVFSGTDVALVHWVRAGNY